MKGKKSKKQFFKNPEPRKTKKNQDTLIFMYSAIEQKRHHIASPGKCLLYYLGIFPFVPLGLSVYSLVVDKIESNWYRSLLFAAAAVMAVIMLVRIGWWISRIFYVYMIDEKGQLYRLRISNFWYKLKDQTYLLNPMGSTGGRLMRLYYMIISMKIVLENISDTVTYDELIDMGRLWRFDHISDVRVGKRRITFKADVVNRSTNQKQKKASAARKKTIQISRLYENDSQLVRYLQQEEYHEQEKMSDIMKEILFSDSIGKKMIRFTLTWTSLMAWVAVFLLSGDLARGAGIHSGEYVKKVLTDQKGEEREAYLSVNDEEDFFYVEEYGKLYKPVVVLYGFVEIIYLVTKGTDLAIAAVKKEKNPEKQISGRKN